MNNEILKLNTPDVNTFKRNKLSDFNTLKLKLNTTNFKTFNTLKKVSLSSFISHFHSFLRWCVDLGGHRLSCQWRASVSA